VAGFETDVDRRSPDDRREDAARGRRPAAPKRKSRMRDGGIERGATEAALRESEANYRALIDDLPELICRSLPDLTRTHVNHGYCSYFGKSREELIGRNFLDLLSEEDREPLKEHLVSLTPENPVGTFEHRVWRQDGEIRWQQWTNRAVFDEAGKLLGYQAVGRDYNVCKLAEEAPRQVFC